MKICPKCNQTYSDENLNFCLNDGEFLKQYGEDAPPTVMMDPTRVTNQGWRQEPPVSEPISPWQSQPLNNQNQQFGVQNFVQKTDQTLPTVSLVLGILSFLLICCYGGFPLGLAAVVTGYLGMRNADSDPSRYGGRGLAIGGMVLGILSFLSSIVFILFALLAN
jgi:hypothetical protein